MPPPQKGNAKEHGLVRIASNWVQRAPLKAMRSEP